MSRENGKFTPIEYEASGTPFLILTTTSLKTNLHLTHRCITISLDETAEQTYRIIKHQTQLASDLLLRRRLSSFTAGCEKIFRELWRRTPTDVEVVIPFLSLVEERLRMGDPDTKLRRDYQKFISLVMASALLFWPYRMMLKQTVDGKERLIIIADFQDLLNVLPLVSSRFQQIVTNLSDKERLVLEKMGEQDSWTYAELAKVTKLSSSLLRHKIIPSLEVKGYVIVDREGKTHRIELAKSPESLNIDVSNMREKALNMINEAISLLLLSGCQIAKSEISPVWPLIQENKPENLAFQQNAKFPSLSGENKPNLSFSTIWHTGTEDKAEDKREDDNSFYINVLEGGHPT